MKERCEVMSSKKIKVDMEYVKGLYEKFWIVLDEFKREHEDLNNMERIVALVQVLTDIRMKSDMGIP